MNAAALLSATGIGLGMCLIGVWLLRPRQPLLVLRLAAMMPGVIPDQRNRWWKDLPHLAGVRLGGILGGGDHVKARLEHAGCDPDLEAFRTSQAMWGLYGLAGSAVFVGVCGSASGVGPLSAAGLIAIASASGVVAKDQALTRAAKQREKRMLAEFPAVADMLALAVAAGQGPLGAIEHVTGLCGGPLAGELGRALGQARGGLPLMDALTGVERRTSLLPIKRFIEGIIVALERGTPLADVLRAQAQDAREAARGELIESAGKKEVLMMATNVNNTPYSGSCESRYLRPSE